MEVVPSAVLDLVLLWVSGSRACISHRRNVVHHRSLSDRLNASSDYVIDVDGAQDESGDRRVGGRDSVVLRVQPLHPRSAASPSCSAGVSI